MGQSNKQPERVLPKAHQITIITAMMDNDAQLSCFSIHTREAFENMLMQANLANKDFISIVTGDESETDANSIMHIAIKKVILITIADVKQPSNIIKADFRLQQ
jgi:hypothetical protein